MNAGHAAVEQPVALVRGVVGPDVADRFGIILDGLDLLEKFVGNPGTAHLRETFDLFDTLDGHQAGENRHVDSHFGSPIPEGEEVVIVEEELGDEKTRAGVDLALEVLQVEVRIRALRMAFGMAGGPDAKVVPVTNESDQLVGECQTAFGGYKLFLPLGRITAQRQNVFDSLGLQFVEHPGVP